MVPQDDDPPWENEFDGDTKLDPDKTVSDGREAVPETVPPFDTTGKYKTLPGFADAVEQTREHYLALGEIRGIKRVLTALRLIRLSVGDRPDTADDVVEKFKEWMAVNDALIRVTMDKE